MKIKIWIISFFLLRTLLAAEEDISANEYCNIELFEATCAPDEVIIMTKAQFGRMRIGRCITVDLGYIGCGADVLYIFDEHCSGKQSCSVLVGDKDMDSQSTCMQGLLQYLEADYKCVKSHTFEYETCRAQTAITVSSAEEVILSQSAFESNCVQVNKPWILTVGHGQRLNISLIDFKYDSDTESNALYGKLIDVQSGKESTFGFRSRFQELMLSVSNAVEVLLYSSSNRFAFDIKVLGCLDITPPDDAWITRHDDVMEVGCHSGTKSWTLRCENSHWIGAVGYCGTAEDSKEVDTQTGDSNWNISPNVVVFGTCSLVLLVSSVVFLVGVLILKRRPEKYYPAESDGPLLSTFHAQTLSYARTAPNAPSAFGAQQQCNFSTMPNRTAAQVYDNGPAHYKSLLASDKEQRQPSVTDPVKHFVLEDRTTAIK